MSMIRCKICHEFKDSDYIDFEDSICEKCITDIRDGVYITK